MTPIDIVILILAILCVTGGVAFAVRRRRRGKGCCGGCADCAHCLSRDSCSSKRPADEKKDE